MSWLRCVLFGAFFLMLAGCFNDYENEQFNAIQVSLGEQLIDLQAALEAGVISVEEFETTKAKLLESAAACGGSEHAEEAEDDDDDDDSFWF